MVFLTKKNGSYYDIPQKSLNFVELVWIYEESVVVSHVALYQFLCTRTRI
jgi:hypothetical protein